MIIMVTLLTGAYGRVGTAIIDGLKDKYDFKYFDLNGHPNFDTIVGDVSNYSELNSAIDNDISNIIHLAASSKVDSDWDKVLENNIIGAYNCLEVARSNKVNKLILASTNHVFGMYEKEHEPKIYDKDYELTITKNTPVRPDSYYATSKLFLEFLSKYYVENYKYPKRVYILRLGSIREPDRDHPYADAEKGVEKNRWSRNSKKYDLEVKRMKALWQSRSDLAHMIDCCMKDNSVKYDIFNGISNNERRWFDIKHARNMIGYTPKDSSDQWDKPPSDDNLENKKENSSYIYKDKRC